jgi:hypothetical protein
MERVRNAKQSVNGTVMVDVMQVYRGLKPAGSPIRVPVLEDDWYEY